MSWRETDAAHPAAGGLAGPRQKLLATLRAPVAEFEEILCLEVAAARSVLEHGAKASSRAAELGERAAGRVRCKTALAERDTAGHRTSRLKPGRIEGKLGSATGAKANRPSSPPRRKTTSRRPSRGALVSTATPGSAALAASASPAWRRRRREVNGGLGMVRFFQGQRHMNSGLASRAVISSCGDSR